MFEVGDMIEVKLVNAVGKAIELDENATLVEHNITRDGQTRTVKQWYGNEICTEYEPVIEPK